MQESCRLPPQQGSVQKIKNKDASEVIPDIKKETKWLLPLWARAEIKEHEVHQAGLNTVTRITSRCYEKGGKKPCKLYEQNKCCSSYIYIYKNQIGVPDHTHTQCG